MEINGRLPDVAQLWEAVQEQHARMEGQAAEITQLRAELERQRAEKVTLQSEVAELKGGRTPGERKLSRAGLLKAAAAGAAGLAAGAALGGPQPAFAGTDGDVVLGNANNSATTGPTGIRAYSGFVLNQSVIVGDATDAGNNGNTIHIGGLNGVGCGNREGVKGIGGGANGAGVVGIAPGATDPGVGLGVGVFGTGSGAGTTGVVGKTDSDWGVYGSASAGGVGVVGEAFGGGYGGQFGGDLAQVHMETNSGSIPPALAPGHYQTGDIWVGNGSGRGAVVWLCTLAGNPDTWVPIMHGNSNTGSSDTLLTKVSTQQYTLANSDGNTWMDMDGTNLSLSVTPKQNSLAIISGNSDLWTSQAGYNQDLGISVSGGAYPTTGGQPEAWKESGGFAGTFSPNAAFVQTVLPLVAGTAYTLKLQWKANKNASGATIWAGAGPIGGKFSPTRLTVLLVPAP